MRIGFHLNLEESDHADFTANGFNGRRFDHPVVFVDFYRDRSWLEGVDDHVDTVWEIRIGDRVMRRWAPVNMVASFNWREAQLLLEGAGDWRFTLYNTKAGVLQQATLPRDALFDVERTLQRMHARVLEKLREKETLCRSEQVEESTEGEIILTH